MLPGADLHCEPEQTQFDLVPPQRARAAPLLGAAAEPPVAAAAAAAAAPALDGGRHEVEHLEPETLRGATAEGVFMQAGVVRACRGFDLGWTWV